MEINMGDVGAQSTISMEDLCTKSLDKFRKTEKIPNLLVNQVTQLYWNLEFAWRKLCLIENLKNQMCSQQNLLLRYRFISTAHYWMFEDILPATSGINTIDRSVIISRLAESAQSISAFSSTIKAQRDELTKLKTSIDHRLKWAVGANPNLMTLMNEFSYATSNKDNLMDSICALADDALTKALAILRYENLRSTTADAHDDDQKFMNLITRWEKMCMMTSCVNVITPVEEGLIELLDPEGPIDPIWLIHVTALIDNMIEQIQNDIGNVEKSMSNIPDELQACTHQLRNLMATHHRIAPKVLGVINSVYQFVDQTQQAIIDDYIGRHQTITETLDDLQSHIMSKDYTEDIVNTSLKQIAVLLDEIAVIFDGLIDVDRMLSQSIENKSKVAQLQQQENVSRADSPSRPKGQKGKEEILDIFFAFRFCWNTKMTLFIQNCHFPHKIAIFHTKLPFFIQK